MGEKETGVVTEKEKSVPRGHGKTQIPFYVRGQVGREFKGGFYNDLVSSVTRIKRKRTKRDDSRFYNEDIARYTSRLNKLFGKNHFADG